MSTRVSLLLVGDDRELATMLTRLHGDQRKPGWDLIRTVRGLGHQLGSA